MATTEKKVTKIDAVYGNVLRLAIPLTLRTITLENGEIVVTNTDYTPSSNYPVSVEFSNGPACHYVGATMRDGNIAIIEDKGTIPVGKYAITVCCKDDNGDPRRFKQKGVLQVHDLTACAGIEAGTEFDGTEWYLDAAVFLAVKGEDGDDGVGIADITTNETDISGDYNTITFTLTDGTSYTLYVRNGESIEQTLPAGIVRDEDYVHTDNNYTDDDKSRVQKIDSLETYSFGWVNYDSNSKRINFYAHGDTLQENPLGYVDATPFVIDGMLDNVRVVNDNFVFTFNTDSGKTPIYIPISLFFDRNNYYTAGQINAIIGNYYNKSAVDTMFNNYYNKSIVDNKLSQKADASELTNKVNRSELSNYAQLDPTTGNLRYSQAPRLALDFIDGIEEEDAPTPTIGIGTLYGTSDGNIALTIESWDDVHIVGSAIDLIFYNKNTEALYTYKQGGFGEESGWVKISSSGDGGSSTQVQADWNQSDSSAVDYIKNKPTIPTVPITSIKMNGSTVSPSSGEVNLGTVITSHQDISGKADKSTTYTKTDVDTALAGKLSPSDVSVSTPSTPDGTVVITVGSSTYTINLNHDHNQYATKKTVESNTDSTVTLSADVIYNLGTVSGNKTINLPTTVDAAAEYEFRLAYTSGTITLPSGVSVANDATLTFTAGKTYQVVICGGILYYSETTVSA